MSAVARDALTEKGYDPKYGARPLRRVLQREIEDALADELLAGRIKDGDEVQMSLVKGKTVWKVRPRGGKEE